MTKYTCMFKLTFSKIQLAFVLSCLLLFAVSCNGGGTKQKNTVKLTEKQKAPIFQLPASIDTVQIDSFLVKYPAFNEFSVELKEFYRSKSYQYAWFDNKGLIEAAQHLVGYVKAPQRDGVLKKAVYSKELFALMEQQISKKSPLLDLELMLTAQYFGYAKSKWAGAELSKAKDLGWYLPEKKLSYAELLNKQLSSTASSIEQDAVIPQYIALRKMLNHYQKLDETQGDVLVPDDTLFKKISIGDTLESTKKLSERLYQLGDLKKKSSSGIYDQDLADAVKNFKKRHALRADFSINARFLKELNVPLKNRIQKMMINLERMRWIPLGDHGSKFILVNIPAFQLYYYEENKLSWTCNVVVGKEMSQTVIFGGNLQYVVFSPYWYVPQSIIKKEVLPAMRKDAGYLDKHRMEWNGGNVRQKPGKDNSLGLVKFIFPNDNDIYLHDTPSKPLFKEEVRAFSHGCIRVEQPKELAKILLPNWTSDNINKAMNRGKEQWITLKTKVPVYIGYFTAYVDSAGQLNFRGDIYQRDERLLDMLMK
ncbi:L,D-transpeptidase family protein [Pedobacter sp. MW01-1-1]|uniref:L,D-transpeptidase family protein n=1 Tax=Pedobacter sp. MW01-1-1 TaxID=3383027 RepID=UPI003FEE7089